MHIAITGSHGLIGTELMRLLTNAGHQVTRLVRGPAAAGEIEWDPTAAEFAPPGLMGVSGVVHLAGENIAARRWSAAQKERIRSSRVDGTRRLCKGLAQMSPPPKVLVAASAVGYYGNRGSEVLTEESPPGEGFLAGVVRDWEAAAEPAAAAGIRVVQLRFGIVLSPSGGALGKMLTPFRFGLGGIVGSGQQYWSWITLADAVRAVVHALVTDTLRGPTNAVAPTPVTNAEFTKALGRIVSRPTFVRIPAAAVRMALGEMADGLLLASVRAEPQRLAASGYQFDHPDLDGAAAPAIVLKRRWGCGKPGQPTVPARSGCCRRNGSVVLLQ